MKTRIFAYKNVLGAESDIENNSLNGINDDGELVGFIIPDEVEVPIDEIEITLDAINLLKTAQRIDSDYAPIKIKKESITLGGLGFHWFEGSDLAISRDCDLSVLDTLQICDYCPEDFIAFVDYEFNRNELENLIKNK